MAASGRHAFVECFALLFSLMEGSHVTTAVKHGASLGKVEEFLLNTLAPTTRALHGDLIQGFVNAVLAETGMGGSSLPDGTCS